MGARVLVLGLDGATWAVIDRLGARLPHLSRLRREGASGPLRSTVPPMTLPAWTSFTTGVNPGAHGILDFTRRVPGTYRLEWLDRTHRRVPSVHRWLSDRGRRVASIAVPGTWPPEPVDGVVVAGFDSPVATAAEAVHCAPRSLHDALVDRFGGWRYADFQEGRLDDAWFAHARGALLREIGRKEAVCRWLLDRETWDLFMVVFGESDTAAHHFWMFHDPASPRYRPGGPDVVGEVYRRLDAAVGELARRAEVVCVASDHGFGPASDVVVYLDRWLEEAGWLRFAGGGGGGEALRRLALGWPVERLVRRVPPGWLAAAETRARWGTIDFRRTRAWSDELSYAPTIHLNVRGREPWGTVDDVDRAVADLERALLAWTVEGRPVVERVVRRAEAWRGPAAEGAPDLVLELALRDGASLTPLPSARVPAGTTWRRLDPAEHAGGKGLGTNGAHRPEGVLLLHGPGVRRGARVEAGLVDVLPTLLALLGEPAPEGVEGRVIAGALVDPAEPPRLPAPAPARPRPGGGHLALRRRLEQLGYR